MTRLIPADDWDGVDTCNTCHRPVDFDTPVCSCCSEPVCPSCLEVIAGMPHCPECAELAREFIRAGEVTGAGESHHPSAHAPAMPDHRQILLPRAE